MHVNSSPHLIQRMLLERENVAARAEAVVNRKKPGLGSLWARPGQMLHPSARHAAHVVSATVKEGFRGSARMQDK